MDAANNKISQLYAIHRLIHPIIKRTHTEIEKPGECICLHVPLRYTDFAYSSTCESFSPKTCLKYSSLSSSLFALRGKYIVDRRANTPKASPIYITICDMSALK